jgi:two-component system LytT family response regulator
MQALIIDDEKHCREGLQIMLSKYCPDLEVMAQCPSARAALQAIAQYHPDLVFLDIEMPDMNGFEMLEHCKEYDFEIIFTTAYNEYAIQAIRHSALDYLEKPVNKDELIRAVARSSGSKRPAASARVTKLLDMMEEKRSSERMALPTIDGLIIIGLKDILYCESEKNYTRFHMLNGRTIFVSKTLKKVEALLLVDKDFFRIHHSFIINLKYMERYFRGDGGEVCLTNGKNIPVSRIKKKEFLERLEKL